jgi:uncharacterized protein (DUF305 family)
MKKELFAILVAAAFAAACGQPASDHSQHGANANPTSNQAMHGDHAGHGDSSPGAAAAPVELQFLDTMIVHHEGAIDMAKLAEDRAQRPQLKQLAKKMIADQQREIAEMQAMRERLHPGAPKAVNMDLPGMRGSMHDLTNLRSLKGAEFDNEFINLMTQHHMGALIMSTDVMHSSKVNDVRHLANTIISEQSKEIEQMKQWLPGNPSGQARAANQANRSDR